MAAILFHDAPLVGSTLLLNSQYLHVRNILQLWRSAPDLWTRMSDNQLELMLWLGCRNISDMLQQQGAVPVAIVFSICSPILSERSYSCRRQAFIYADNDSLGWLCTQQNL